MMLPRMVIFDIGFLGNLRLRGIALDPYYHYELDYSAIVLWALVTSSFGHWKGAAAYAC